jgi:hypothetical protein
MCKYVCYVFVICVQIILTGMIKKLNDLHFWLDETNNLLHSIQFQEDLFVIEMSIVMFGYGILATYYTFIYMSCLFS